jgi:competence protein ComEA
MAESEDKSSTLSTVEAVSIVATTADAPTPPQTSLVESDQAALPVASTWDDPAQPLPAPLPIENFWGLSARDCLLLLVLAAACLGLSIWHWGQMSGWGMEPVEVDRAAERVYDYRIDLNQATWVELLQLPGIGESLARRILDYREQHGPFESVDELDHIKGIGPKTIEKLRPWLIVDQPAAE